MKITHPAATRYALDLARFGIESDEANLARAYLELREKATANGQKAIERIDVLLDEMLAEKEDGVTQLKPMLLKPMPRVEVIEIDTPEKAMELLGYVPGCLREPAPVMVHVVDETKEKP